MESVVQKTLDSTESWDAESLRWIFLDQGLSELTTGAGLASRLLPQRQTRTYCMAKRSIDVALTVIMLPILLPLLLLIAVAIKLDSPGPILYRGKRVGHLGQCLTMFQFRSMVHNADPSLHRDYVQQLMRSTGP